MRRYSILTLAAIFLTFPAVLLGAFSGIVRDVSGEPIARGIVEIRSSSGVLLFETRTNAEGRFEWREERSGPFQIRVTGEGFDSRELVVSADHDSQSVEIILGPASVYTRITVNATRGSVEESGESPHVAAILEQADLSKRPMPTLGNVLEGLPGVLVQQSTVGQVSPFLRGLTGYQVLNLMDGIRFNNTTFRSGPNQYLAFIELSQAQRIEALLGPTGVQYGSDSLGGTIQVLTKPPRFEGGWRTHADLTLGGTTADLSSFAAGRASGDWSTHPT